MSQPIVAVSGESLVKARESDNAVYYQVMQKYIVPVVEIMGAVPLILPPLAEQLDIVSLLKRVDGVLLTGGISNIEPHHYDGGDSYPGCPHDPLRDATVMRLIPEIINTGVPLFAICRGFQELNVAYGGSLHQELHKSDDYELHAEQINFEAPMDGLYADAHDLEIQPGGILDGLVGLETQRVNSIHGQGIDRLGEGLFLEGKAPDGIVEAISVKDAKNFALAVQWHPEWKPKENPLYMAMWQAFAETCRKHAQYTRKECRSL